MIPRGATHPPATSLEGLVAVLDGSLVRGGTGTLGGVWCGEVRCGGPPSRPTDAKPSSVSAMRRSGLVLHEHGRRERRDEERAGLLAEFREQDHVVVRRLL